MRASRLPLLGSVIASVALLATLSGCSLSPGLGGGGSSAAAARSAAPAASAGASASAPASASASASASKGGAVSSKDIDACTLVSAADVSTLDGQPFTGGVSSTIATGQDACAYQSTSGNLTVIVYQPGSGVSWSIMTSVLSNTGTPVAVSGIGDKAMESGIEVDVQVGNRVFSVQGNDFNLPNTEAVAKAVAAALGK